MRVDRHRNECYINAFVYEGDCLEGGSIMIWAAILFSGHPGISVNELSPLSLRQ